MLFSPQSRALIYGRQIDVAARMLDFDFLSGRSPSVVGFIDPMASGTGVAKVFFGNKELLLPIYPSFDAVSDWSGIDTLVNFASFRSAARATHEALDAEKFSTIAVIAEGIPERDSRALIARMESLGVMGIGPATVGGIAAGAFRIGNTGWSLDNILASRLYRPGSVGVVSRSGGMSNELYRMLSRTTDGVHTGIALGGDRFVFSTFEQVVRAYQAEKDISLIVLLWEVGSEDELAVARLVQEGVITKPIVAHISGYFGEISPSEVQFGHAGARANAKTETASYKNTALRDAGIHVAESFSDFESLIHSVYTSIHGAKAPIAQQEDDSEAKKKLSLIASRRPTRFTSTISDERGEEVLYHNIPLDEFVATPSISRVIGHLWMKRELPEQMLRFIDTILVILADHGPAVSGATNAIVTARAGRDLVSALVSGLLTVGPRFGGAIDGAARAWSAAVGSGESPEAFVDRMKRQGTYVQGIGHKVRSKFNPDARVAMLSEFSAKCTCRQHYEFARAVEAITLEKKPNLILNVDGVIAAILLDMMTDIGIGRAEREVYIEAWIFNAFFVLARSVGFIGHIIDQKRLGEPLYRTPTDDILYGTQL